MILLEVPFAEKESAKSLGAKWNAIEKKWYIPTNLEQDIENFNKWLPIKSNLANKSNIAKDYLTESTAPANDKQVGISLSQLMAKIQQSIKHAIANNIWVIAEVVNINERRGHYYFELAQTLEDGQQVANCRAMIWQSNVTKILDKFTELTGSSIDIGQKILLLVEPTFHEKFGFSLIIQDIDPNYTLGELEAKVQAIRQQLIKEKLYDNNKQFKLPKDFFRLAVIAPPNAAGLGDFRVDADLLDKQQLCEFKYFYCSFQGHKVEQEMQAAFSAFNALHKAKAFDALIIIRGGGAKLDLQPLNNYELAKEIATANLPVVTGIGHERDKTILDEVSAVKFDTPSKVINYIINTIFSAAQQAQQNWLFIETSSQVHIQKQKQLITELNQTILNSSNIIIQNKRISLLPLNLKIEQLCKDILNKQQFNIKQANNIIKLQINAQLKSQQDKLNHHKNIINSMPLNIISRSKEQLKQSIKFILSSGINTQLNRGFAIVFNKKGKPITTAKQAKQATDFQIKFKDEVIEASLKKD